MNQRELRHPQDNGARGLLAFGHEPLIVQCALRITVAVGMDHAHRASVARHTLQTHICIAEPFRGVCASEIRPVRAKSPSRRYSGSWSAYFATSTCASKPLVATALVPFKLPIGPQAT